MIRKLSSRIVYRNRWMSVREDEIERADGGRGIYGVVDKQDFVLVIPFQDGLLYLVEQYRYPVGQRFCEFPQGSWESVPEVDQQAVAAGELREETGLTAGRLELLGEMFNAYGYSTQGMAIFLATELTASSREVLPEEQDLRVRATPIADIEEMIRNGEIRDAATVAAYGLLQLKQPDYAVAGA